MMDNSLDSDETHKHSVVSTHSQMGNNSSSSIATADLINSSPSDGEDTFKVDNINSYGRKHASAKIQISYDDLCIVQKRRQSLHIPLATIKRYGIDGSIFILECGRRAPMGPARYAFRCKQAHRLVSTLDHRITTVSKQLSEQARQECLLSSSSTSTLTNVSSTINHHHHHSSRSSVREDRRRTQSDHSDLHHVSSSPSLTSMNSGATDSYRNSVPNLSENYLSFEQFSDRSETSYEDERDRPFIARLKQPIQQEISEELNYVAVKTDSLLLSMTEQDLLHESDVTSISTFATQQPSWLFYDSTRPNSVQSNDPCQSIASKSTTSYVYIDHERTTTLKDIAKERLEQHSRHNGSFT